MPLRRGVPPECTFDTPVLSAGFLCERKSFVFTAGDLPLFRQYPLTVAAAAPDDWSSNTASLRHVLRQKYSLGEHIGLLSLPAKRVCRWLCKITFESISARSANVSSCGSRWSDEADPLWHGWNRLVPIPPLAIPATDTLSFVLKFGWWICSCCLLFVHHYEKRYNINHKQPFLLFTIYCWCFVRQPEVLCSDRDGLVATIRPTILRPYLLHLQNTIMFWLNSTENYGRRCLTPLSPHRNYILS